MRSSQAGRHMHPTLQRRFAWAASSTPARLECAEVKVDCMYVVHELCVAIQQRAKGLQQLSVST